MSAPYVATITLPHSVFLEAKRLSQMADEKGLITDDIDAFLLLSLRLGIKEFAKMIADFKGVGK